MKCRKCGAKLPNDMNFCGYCGAKLEAPPAKDKRDKKKQDEFVDWDDVPTHAEEQDYKCPTCSAALTYLEQYQRYWCDSCRAYTDFEARQSGTTSQVSCSYCSSNVDYMEQYQQYWCPKCQKYVPPRFTSEEPPPPKSKPKKGKSERMGDAKIEGGDAGDFEEEPEQLETTKCPKCKHNIKIPYSRSKKVSLKCRACGAKGRVPNPYLNYKF